MRWYKIYRCMNGQYRRYERYRQYGTHRFVCMITYKHTYPNPYPNPKPNPDPIPDPKPKPKSKPQTKSPSSIHPRHSAMEKTLHAKPGIMFAERTHAKCMILLDRERERERVQEKYAMKDRKKKGSRRWYRPDQAQEVPFPKRKSYSYLRAVSVLSCHAQPGRRVSPLLPCPSWPDVFLFFRSVRMTAAVNVFAVAVYAR